MENANRTELSGWVEERTAVLAPPPGWEPDVDLATARFKSALRNRPASRRYWLPVAIAVCLLCAVLGLVPATRAFAQQLWRSMTVGRIEVVRVDFDSLPDEATSLSLKAINKPAPPKAVDDVAEATSLAGFVPRLPRPDLLRGTPHLAVLGPMSYGTKVKKADLELALQKAGVSDEVVPELWDGAQLGVQIGSTVTAEWNGITLMQGLPAVLSTPAGFDLSGFASSLLRAVGMNREAARQFGHQLVASPALLLGITAEDAATIRQVHLNSGPATLIEDIGDDGKRVRVTLLWSVPDRIYILSGAISVETATSLANSVH